MKSSTTPRFREAFSDLPHALRTLTKEKYHLWRLNPKHPSLHFKKVGPFWSVRITGDYRALAILKDGVYYWFWIGPHSEYDEFLKRR